MSQFDLDRYVTAQEPIYAQALAELQAGRKQSHWMWFIFPQIAGLGRSETARFYAIQSAEEARAYLAHPQLGPRLYECTEAINQHAGQPAAAILGAVDALKLRSSMTLFEAVAAAPEREPFERCLQLFFGGERDQETLARLPMRIEKAGDRGRTGNI